MVQVRYLTPPVGFRGKVRRRIAIVLGAALFAFATGLFSSTLAFAQSPAPGPLLGTGSWAENGRPADTWEEYPGGMLLIFSQKWLFQAFPAACAFSDTAVCYTWKQYHYVSADPYNTSFWLPYARGCMVLGADPATVGTSAGLSEQTDISSAGENWIPELKPVQTDTATNAAAGGTAAAPDATALPSQWTYDRCFTGSGPGSDVVANCSMTYTGNWNGEISTRTNTATLLKVGQGLSVRITAGPVFDDEITFLSDPAGSWSVRFTGNSAFNFVASTLKPRLAGRTLSVSGSVAGPVVSSTFGLQVVNQGSAESWNLATCNMSL